MLLKGTKERRAAAHVTKNDCFLSLSLSPPPILGKARGPGIQTKLKASNLMQGQSHQFKTVLEQMLEMKDSPGNPLSCSPKGVHSILRGKVTGETTLNKG